MSGANLVFHGTTGPGLSNGASQPDPEDWLGRWRAAEVVHEIQSTLTAAQANTSRHIIVDSARIGDGVQAHQMKWIAMQTGGAAPSAARIASFDDATGTFKLDRQLVGSLGQIGDTYRLFAPGNVFPNVTAEQAATGHESFRAICLLNSHGTIGAAQKRRIIFRDLGSGDARHYSLIHQTTEATLTPFIERADGLTDVLDVLGQRATLGGPDGFANTSPWVQIFDIADDNVSEVGNVSLGFEINQQAGIWLRRTIPAGARLRRSVAFQVLFLTDDASSDPNPLSSSVLIVYDIDTPDTSAIVTPDRFPAILGGARVRVDVSKAGAQLADRPVRWDVRPGDLGTMLTDDDPVSGYDVTDDDGRAYATLIAPTSQASAGVISHPRARIGAGEEIGDPQPRISLVGATSFAFDVAGEIALPEDSSEYLIPPATGFWSGL